MDLERQWDAAVRNCNVKFIDSILDPDFSRHLRQRHARQARRRSSSALRRSTSRSMTRRWKTSPIRLYGNTAVVQFTLHLLGPIQGKPVEIVYRYIDVWVLREASWRCVASQSTRVTAPRDAPAK
jgi:ketosteroid isomerase-like protein